MQRSPETRVRRRPSRLFISPIQTMSLTQSVEGRLNHARRNAFAPRCREVIHLMDRASTQPSLDMRRPPQGQLEEELYSPEQVAAMEQRTQFFCQQSVGTLKELP